MVAPDSAAVAIVVLIAFAIGASALMNWCSGRSALANMGFAALTIAVLVLVVSLLVQLAMRFAPAY